ASSRRKRGDERDRDPRHLTQIVSYGFGLSALFRAQAGIRAGSIHEGKDGAMEFFRYLHRAQRLAIALGVRHAEVAIHLLLGVPRFLVSDYHYVVAMKARHAANDGGIVGVTAVAVNLTPVSE